MRPPAPRTSRAPSKLTASGSVKVGAGMLGLAMWLADAATEGKKVIVGMLITGLILASPAILGEGYRYLRYYRRGRSPH